MAMALSRFNMIDPKGSGFSERYKTMLDMASYMDENGFYGITLEEHHGVENGWSSTPLMNAGMILSRTKRLSVTISAMLLPLHDPIRAAEDIAVLNLVSDGRLAVILALGYRPEEYKLLQKDWENRGKLMDECVDTLMKAWSGEPFEYKGQQVQVTPKPDNPPVVMLGGSSKAAAKRAARFGLPMSLSANLPELEAFYNEKCQEHGNQGFIMMPPESTVMLFVDKDPDKAWEELGEHFLHEAMMYHSWQTPGIESAVHSHASTPGELREEGIYAVMTPEECLARAEAQGEAAVFTLHPLCGGISPERGWDCVKLFTEEVLSKL